MSRGRGHPPGETLPPALHPSFPSHHPHPGGRGFPGGQTTPGDRPGAPVSPVGRTRSRGSSVPLRPLPLEGTRSWTAGQRQERGKGHGARELPEGRSRPALGAQAAGEFRPAAGPHGHRLRRGWGRGCPSAHRLRRLVAPGTGGDFPFWGPPASPPLPVWPLPGSLAQAAARQPEPRGTVSPPSQSSLCL